MTDFDWGRLLDAARDISTHAYVPYSGYRVGAAALLVLCVGPVLPPAFFCGPAALFLLVAA